MRTTKTLIALTASAALLAACGGGGGTTTPAVTYSSMKTSAEAMAAGIIDLDTGTVTAAERTTLPTTGNATYTGYVGGGVDDGVTTNGLIGDLTLNASFAAGGGTVTGTATNFQHQTDGAYAGTLNLTTGTIAPPGTSGQPYTIGGTLGGDLTNGGTTYTTSITLDGTFQGGTGTDVPTSVAGTADGTVGSGLLTGAFIAKQ